MAPLRWRAVVATLLSVFLLFAAAPAEARETRPDGIGPKPPVPTGILINLAARTLYWYKDGALARSFPVGVGTPSSQTILGTFRVQNKQKHPTWYSTRDSRVVPPGPANPLGTRWIGFSGNYGIHGNNNPASIGGLVSLGCVRMYKEDVEWLYDQVSVGTPVIVVYETAQVLYGRDGRRYLAVYPNGYGRTPANPGAVLRAAGLLPDAVTATGPGLYPLDVRGVVNGWEVAAVLHQGKPYLHARDLAGKLGAKVRWDGEASQVALDGQLVPTLLQGETGYVDARTAAAVLGVDFTWDAQAGKVWLTGTPIFLNGHLLSRRGKFIDGIFYVPVRQVAEAAGAEVGWDPAFRWAVVNGEPVLTVLRDGHSFTAGELLSDRLNLRFEWVDGAAHLHTR